MGLYTKKIISIDSDDDDDDYEAFVNYLNEDSKRNKNKFIGEVQTKGNVLLDEINKKNKIKHKKKLELIKYILKRSDKYDRDELMSYDVSDVIEIYEEVKVEKESFFSKFFHFFFNVQ